MAYKLSTILPVSTLAISLAAIAQDPGETRVQIPPLEVDGQADPTFAEAVHQRLTQVVDNDPRLETIAEGSAAYRVQGHIHADEIRRFVGLTLVDLATGKTVWIENFDYTNITADMMAQDLIHALTTDLASGDRE